MRFIFRNSYLLLDSEPYRHIVDKNAKGSLNLEVTDFKIPFNN